MGIGISAKTMRPPTPTLRAAFIWSGFNMVSGFWKSELSSVRTGLRLVRYSKWNREGKAKPSAQHLLGGIVIALPALQDYWIIRSNPKFSQRPVFYFFKGNKKPNIPIAADTKPFASFQNQSSWCFLLTLLSGKNQTKESERRCSYKF